MRAMSWSIIVSAVWVLAATMTALLPMRGQYVPGVALLILAPLLIVWLGYDFGWSVAAFAGFASMFRNPLKYFYARARGLDVEVPK
jgi:membrane glycosyltransferase